MTIHKKLAARLRSTPACLRDGNSASSPTVYGPWQVVADVLADAIEHGDFDDILGVRKPSIEDVKREAVRVFGKHTAVRAWEDGLSIQVGTVVLNEPLYAPTIAAVYAALRAMKDYEGEE